MPDQPEGLFVNLSLEDIQAIKDGAVKLLKEGKTLMSSSAAGVTFTKQFTLPVDQVLRECNYAIKVLSGGGIVRRVGPDFSRGGIRGRWYGR